jgi:hypothetical protein
MGMTFTRPMSLVCVLSFAMRYIIQIALHLYCSCSIFVKSMLFLCSHVIKLQMEDKLLELILDGLINMISFNGYNIYPSSIIQMP